MNDGQAGQGKVGFYKVSEYSTTVLSDQNLIYFIGSKIPTNRDKLVIVSVIFFELQIDISMKL